MKQIHFGEDIDLSKFYVTGISSATSFATYIVRIFNANNVKIFGGTIFIGTLHPPFERLSSPQYPLLDTLDKYDYVSLVIEDCQDSQREYLKSKNVQLCHNDSFYKIETKILKEFLSWINGSGNNLKEEKVGGNCCICGDYDKWGYWKEDKCYCYKHTP